MLKTLMHWLIVAIAFLIVSHVVPGFRVANIRIALIVSVIYGFLIMVSHVLLLPFAYTIFILIPRRIWQFLCLLLVNSALLLAIGNNLHLRGFAVADYQSAVIAAVLLSLVTSVIEAVL